MTATRAEHRGRDELISPTPRASALESFVPAQMPFSCGLASRTARPRSHRGAGTQLRFTEDRPGALTGAKRRSARCGSIHLRWFRVFRPLSPVRAALRRRSEKRAPRRQGPPGIGTSHDGLRGRGLKRFPWRSKARDASTHRCLDRGTSCGPQLPAETSAVTSSAQGPLSRGTPSERTQTTTWNLERA